MPLRWSFGTPASAFSSSGRLSLAVASACSTSSVHHFAGGSATADADQLEINAKARKPARRSTIDLQVGPPIPGAFRAL